MKSTAAQRKLVIVLFVLVLITFSFAQRDSKRLERQYTLAPEKKSPVAAAKKEVVAVPVVK
jgi:hypothetical protein